MLEKITGVIAANKVIQAIIFAIALWVLYMLRYIVVLFFFAFIIMSAVRPFADNLRRRRVPKMVAILLPYVIVVGLIVFIGYEVLSTFAGQVGPLATNLSVFVNKLQSYLASRGLATRNSFSLSSILSGAYSSIASLPLTIFDIAISAATVIIISIYLLWDPRYLNGIFGTPDGGNSLSKEVEYKMGRWLVGQFVLSAIIGVIAGAGLFVLGVPSAPLLGVITALLEVVPFVGPIISAIIAMLVAANASFGKVILVAIFFIIIQQIEGNLIVPLVMKKSVDLHPITVILSILIGTQLLGVIGAIAAVPFAVAFSIIVPRLTSSAPS